MDVSPYSPYHDKVFVSFIDFTENAVMLAEEWTHPLLGGGPLKQHPMRAESFLYPKNNYVSDDKRTIMQGRLNIDTASHGPKFWGSYK